MPKTGQQLPLHLPLEVATARDDLVVTDANRQAVAYVDAWPEWPGSVTLLAGPVGSGKSHLADIWAARAGATFLEPVVGSSGDIPEGGNYVVEDVVRGSFSETWLFHLINAVRASRGSLLITSRRFPSAWGVVLPDLASRLKAAHLVELNEPDDPLLSGILVKLFSDRQLIVDADVVDYLVMRMERSIDSARKLVEQIDHLSLAEKRAVTKPLAGQALKLLGLKD